MPVWVVWCSAALTWVESAALALLFWRLGSLLDLSGSPSAPAIGEFVLPTAFALVAALCAAAGRWLAQWSSAGAERGLRRLVVSGVHDLGVVRSAGRSGELLSLATAAVERTATYRAAFLGPMLGALTAPFLVLGVMGLAVDAVTAGWLALLVLVVPVVIGVFQRLVRPIGAQYRRTQARLTAAFLEAIQALDLLAYSRAADRAASELAQRGEEHRRGVMRLLAGNQLLILVVDAAFSLTVVVAAAALAVGRIATGQLSLGAGVAILLMATLVVGPVDLVGQFFYVGMAGRAAQRQLEAHLEAGTAASNTAGAPASRSEGERGGLTLEDVTAGWVDDRPVLRGFSLRVAPGETVALVGPSGIGKSTVSALVQAHLLPQSGRVLVDGLDTSTADPDVVRSRIAVVEQRTFLFLGSIGDNLRVAAPDAEDDQLWQALDLAGLREEVEAMPAGLDTPVGEHGRLLSGGQAQRLAIARAALRDSPILVLDEPTSQVDLAGEAAVLAALGRLARGRTVLVIAHRPGAILTADRVVRLGGEETAL